MLTVIDQYARGGRTWAKALCECGEEVEVILYLMTSGRAKSCGCWGKSVSITHGGSSSPEYGVFSGILGRCLCKTHTCYGNYGGRGINVLWDSFEEFYRDMGPRPTAKHTIERIDVDGHYCKDNCIWVDDRSLQTYNQRRLKRNTSGRTGVSWNEAAGKWAVEISANKVRYRLGTFSDFEEAVRVRELAELEHYGFIKE